MCQLSDIFFCHAAQHLTIFLSVLTFYQYSWALFICRDPDLPALCKPAWKITDPTPALG